MSADRVYYSRYNYRNSWIIMDPLFLCVGQNWDLELYRIYFLVVVYKVFSVFLFLSGSFILIFVFRKRTVETDE